MLEILVDSLLCRTCCLFQLMEHNDDEICHRIKKLSIAWKIDLCFIQICVQDKRHLISIGARVHLGPMQLYAVVDLLKQSWNQTFRHFFCMYADYVYFMFII